MLRLSVRGATRRPWFEDVSLELEAGEIVVLSRPSGSGKTLLLRALADLADLDALDSGAVELEGRELNSFEPGEWRARMTYLHQVPVRAPGDVRANIDRIGALDRQVARRGASSLPAAELARQAGVALDAPVQNLSGGEAGRLALGLGLGRRMIVAGVRASLQLALLGLLLRWIFSIEGPWLVVAWMLMMALVAGREAVRRTSHRVPGQLRMSVGVMLWSSMAVSLYGLMVVLRVDPWYTPRYAIPLLGLVLGNTLNGVALGLETALSGFVLERDQVELLLAHGATRREAARTVLRRAARTGMIPILNSMVAAGIVSIPGMMTGQILSGADPSSAARYQIFVLFNIAGGVTLGTIGAVLGATRLVFDDRDRLRLDRIRS